MLHMAGKKDTFLSGKLGPFSVGQQDRGGVCLESSDGLGLACLSHHVHSLQGTHGGGSCFGQQTWTEDVHVLVNKRGQRMYMFWSTNVDRGCSCFGQQTWTEALHVLVNKRGQRLFMFRSTNVDRGSSCFGQQTWTEALHVSVNKRGQRLFMFRSTNKDTGCSFFGQQHQQKIHRL